MSRSAPAELGREFAPPLKYRIDVADRLHRIEPVPVLPTEEIAEPIPVLRRVLAYGGPGIGATPRVRMSSSIVFTAPVPIEWRNLTMCQKTSCPA